MVTGRRSADARRYLGRGSQSGRTLANNAGDGCDPSQSDPSPSSPGSSYLGGYRPGVAEPAADEEHAKAVVVTVSEAAGDAAVEFAEAVDGFGAAVGGAAGVEVGQERSTPLFQSPAEAGDLGDRAGRE